MDPSALATYLDGHLAAPHAVLRARERWGLDGETDDAVLAEIAWVWRRAEKVDNAKDGAELWAWGDRVIVCRKVILDESGAWAWLALTVKRLNLQHPGYLKRAARRL